MAFDPNTQERVYRALKQEYVGGAFTPGVRLDLHAIADRHRASTTPVREAVHRLIGEQLLEPHPDGGIRLAILTAHDLSELYLWNAHHILSTLRLANNSALRAMLRPLKVRSPHTPGDHVALTGELFAAIGKTTGIREFIAQIDRTNERLHYFRLAEVALFVDFEREFATFLRNGSIDVRSNLRRRVIAYHRRRIEHVDAIAHVLHAGSQG